MRNILRNVNNDVKGVELIVDKEGYFRSGHIYSVVNKKTNMGETGGKHANIVISNTSLKDLCTDVTWLSAKAFYHFKAYRLL